VELQQLNTISAPTFDFRTWINDHASGGCAFGAFTILEVLLKQFICMHPKSQLFNKETGFFILKENFRFENLITA